MEQKPTANRLFGVMSLGAQGLLLGHLPSSLAQEKELESFVHAVLGSTSQDLPTGFRSRSQAASGHLLSPGNTC